MQLTGPAFRVLGGVLAAGPASERRRYGFEAFDFRASLRRIFKFPEPNAGQKKF
jgi:hypothetical protein